MQLIASRSWRKQLSEIWTADKREYHQRINTERASMDKKNLDHDPLWPEDQYSQSTPVGNAASSSSQASDRNLDSMVGGKPHADGRV